MASLYFAMPGNNDILGDRWASRVRSLFDAACKRLDVPQVGKGMGAVWNLFQWQYCKGADMMCRVVASPQAMVACGWDITPDLIELSERLLDAQSAILAEQKAACRLDLN